MPNVFISYVRENSALVDKFAGELRRYGVTVWLDREQLIPGMRWQQAIRKAIRGGDFFIACFSAESAARSRTYQNEELVLAIEELRLRPTDRIWFIPVLLSEGTIPDRDIGGGETLNSIQWAALYENWDEGIRRVLSAIGISPQTSGRPDTLTISEPARLEPEVASAGELPMSIGPTKDSEGYSNAKPQDWLYLPEYSTNMPWHEGVRGTQVLPIIDLDDEMIRVDAGPGTGKTYGLVRRVQRILHPNGLNVPGNRVLVVAFNRVIAKQLQKDIDERLANSPHDGNPVIQTVHAPD